jgi:hypothetical protein
MQAINWDVGMLTALLLATDGSEEKSEFLNVSIHPFTWLGLLWRQEMSWLVVSVTDALSRTGMVKFQPVLGTLNMTCDVNCSVNEFVHCWIFALSELAA